MRRQNNFAQVVCALTTMQQRGMSRRWPIRQNSAGGRTCPQLSASRPCRLDPCPLTLELNLYADDQCMSQDDGIKHYTEGERWKPEKCTSCQCVNSRKVCQPIECPKQECSNPVEMPGFCCLFCIGQ
ncbi:unnamed protein product [Clavelina lepadiformis]|uniref:VWFC domain-containing protein n=1 Tax=Clavelina lepadiformis TaxID=159417 RepID=A0ABP0GWI7_CLALP